DAPTIGLELLERHRVRCRRYRDPLREVPCRPLERPSRRRPEDLSVQFRNLDVCELPRRGWVEVMPEHRQDCVGCQREHDDTYGCESTTFAATVVRPVNAGRKLALAQVP